MQRSPKMAPGPKRALEGIQRAFEPLAIHLPSREGVYFSSRSLTRALSSFMKVGISVKERYTDAKRM